MITKMCARCGKITVYPARYCSTCLPIVMKEREEIEAKQKAKAMSKYNKQRDPKFVQFYKSKAWHMLSARYMQDHSYRCECCGGLATDVHHIIPIQIPEGWEKRFDVSNLKCLCVNCHNAKHNRFQKKKHKVKDKG